MLQVLEAWRTQAKVAAQALWARLQLRLMVVGPALFLDAHAQLALAVGLAHLLEEVQALLVVEGLEAASALLLALASLAQPLAPQAEAPVREKFKGPKLKSSITVIYLTWQYHQTT